MEKHTDNCPDFAFVEYGLLEIPEWQEEYESDSAEIVVSSARRLSVNSEEDGDDAFNKPFFDFLVEVAKGYFRTGRAPLRPVWAGVQMLDSEHLSFWKP